QCVYVGKNDFNIKERGWNNNGWHHNDLTAATSAPLPGVNQSMSAYAFEHQGTQHVVYVGQNDFHINELWWATDGSALEIRCLATLGRVTSTSAYRSGDALVR